VKRMTALAMALMFLVAANLMRVEATTATNLTRNKSKRRLGICTINSLRSMLRDHRLFCP
jgi:hypothetical protein